MRKTLLMPLAMLLLIVNANAQFYKPLLPSPAFSENLGKITQAFRNNYYQIQGEALPSQEDVDVYRSSVALPGAKQCVIYRFHSKTDTTASWQGIMYTGDSYKDALKQYKNTCRLVDKCRVKFADNTAASFTGKIDEPETELRFVSSLFTLNTKDAVYDHFYAEVEMVNLTFDQWEVRLNLQSKKEDTEK